MKTALICGAGGMIGSHLAKKLKSEGYHVTGVDLKKPEFSETQADRFIIGDLREIVVCRNLFLSREYDEIYQFAADMGGALFVFTGENDADIMHNSAMINLNILECIKNTKSKIFYSSSACAYPEENQMDINNPNCEESSAFPANPDSVYGFEKLFSELIYDAYNRNYGVDIRIGRFHNVFAPEGTWTGGREKAPAALCRKVSESKGEIEIWGDGLQTRSFLYIDECLDGVSRLMKSDYKKPVNIGSDEMISINDLAKMIMEIAGKDLKINNIESNALGVRARCSDNKLIYETLGWKPTRPLKEGMEKLYLWIDKQVNG